MFEAVVKMNFFYITRIRNEIGYEIFAKNCLRGSRILFFWRSRRPEIYRYILFRMELFHFADFVEGRIEFIAFDDPVFFGSVLLVESVKDENAIAGGVERFDRAAVFQKIQFHDGGIQFLA